MAKIALGMALWDSGPSNSRISLISLSPGVDRLAPGVIRIELFLDRLALGVAFSILMPLIASPRELTRAYHTAAPLQHVVG